MLFVSDMFQKLTQLSELYKSTFCLWKGPELFVFIQDIKHIAVSCLPFLSLNSRLTPANSPYTVYWIVQ